MRDKRTPNDVCGEASFLCAQVSSGNRETMELLKICTFDPKALESCENFNVSNVGHCKLVSLVRGFWFGQVKPVESVEVSPTLGLPYLYKLTALGSELIEVCTFLTPLKLLEYS